MKVRFQADADLRTILIIGVVRREPEIDFRTAAAANFSSRSDLEVLETAARDNRILVSHDFKTMPAAFGQFLERRSSPGVFIVPQNMPLLAAIDGLLMIWAASEAEEWLNRICRLPL